ncbi:S-layer homology domain-containing protein [Paenibacillus xylaniclasticus]|uniref:S-layer homology domain-containing protein n=1 Tax=Paenibacillus xylaniclasticus TaxID=588083 RepID=UPI0013E0C327|nr:MULTISPECIES: S-layer homology domain-containing protein [Paenibacillus]GFN32925.1 hypothetical protein PCURB6_31850 [Paenibacillus curdlanolyticus]
MNKKASKWLAIPLAASLLFPSLAANAAAKSSEDFSDLKDVDAGLKAKIDELLSKGVFDGVSEDKFGLNENMNRAQMAKVVTLIYGIPVDQNVKTSSFKDVGGEDGSNPWAIPYIEAAKKAGILDGVGGDKYDPSGEVSIGQLATALVRGLGEKVDVSGTPWYSDAIQKAEQFSIIPAGTDGKRPATRADLVNGAYEGEQAFQEKKAAEEAAKKAEEEAKAAEEEAAKKAAEESRKPVAPITPNLSVGDATAPVITAAAVNGKSVTVTGGTYGTISLAGDEYLTSGTLSVSEYATLTITSIEGIDLTKLSSLSLTQTLYGGSNTLDFINKLGELDPQQDGVSMALLSQLDTDQDGVTVKGTLTDAAGNKTAVELTFKVEELK